MAQAGYHHANLLASKIKEELQENQSQMLAVVKEFSEIYTDNYEQDFNANLDTANAVTQINLQSETLKVLQELQTQLQNLSSEVKSEKNSKERMYKKTPDDLPFIRENTEKILLDTVATITRIVAPEKHRVIKTKLLNQQNGRF